MDKQVRDNKQLTSGEMVGVGDNRNNDNDIKL